MKFAICNILFNEGGAEQDFAEVCRIIARMGYHGVEIAPHTLDAAFESLSPARHHEYRRSIEDNGMVCVGLHCLLRDGFDLLAMDAETTQRTYDHYHRLADCCAELGGRIMVNGSPRQRMIKDSQTFDEGWELAKTNLINILPHIADRGITLCFEPLGPVETNFINTTAEGLKLVREINHPNCRLHLDVKAMSSESRPIEDSIRSVPLEWLGHFHANDPNMSGPGTGDVEYGPIAAALNDIGWDGWISVEAFNSNGASPEQCAQGSIDYLRRCWPTI
ncbi:sugar phosphate isomerase/epimerase [Candidatus Sumerlaeota bacterium]|nr:sugar phosphate isomerase/epimerase [Candidatus Sumerlaeota bacterium]